MIKHKIWAEIDLDALEHNYITVSKEVKKNSPDCRVMCIVKADCYGHGAEICIPKLTALGVSDFGVSCIEEAIELRRYAPDARILILGYTPVDNVAALLDGRFIQTVYSLEYAKEMSDAVVRARGDDLSQKLYCHVKIDTGMNRIGFCASDRGCVKEVYEACNLCGLDFVGAFTHFACADEADDTMSRAQFDSFMSVISDLRRMGIEFQTLHCCNSAASVRYPEFNLDMIRLGIMLYGHSPLDRDLNPPPLKAVMRFVTSVTHVHKLKAGDTVSYGATFTADKDMTVATVAAGYADGFLRAFGGGGMYVGGKYARVVGRICMDQCMLDVTDHENVKVGDEAEIFDPEGINIKRLSSIAHTIDYELLCSVSKRVNRIAISK